MGAEQAPRPAEMTGRQWRDDAKCIGQPPDPWFPDFSNFSPVHNDRVAGELCHGCLVLDDCLDYALIYDVRDGIWGGITPQGRARLTHTLSSHKQRTNL